MKKKNLWTVVLVSVFGSVSLLGSVAYASEGLNGEEAPPDSAPQQEEPLISPAVESNTNMGIQSEIQPQEEAPKEEPPQKDTPQSAPPSNESPESKPSQESKETPPTKEKPSEAPDKAENPSSESTRSQSQSNESSKVSGKEEVTVADNKASQQEGQTDKDATQKSVEKESDAEPKTQEDEMAKTGDDTLPLLLMTLGITGVGATLITRFGFIR